MQLLLLVQNTHTSLALLLSRDLFGVGGRCIFHPGRYLALQTRSALSAPAPGANGIKVISLMRNESSLGCALSINFIGLSLVRLLASRALANGHPGRKKQIWFGDGCIMKEAMRCSWRRAEFRAWIKDAWHEIWALYMYKGTSTIDFDTEILQLICYFTSGNQTKLHAR